MTKTQGVAVVTGGTLGIGRHLVDLLATDGWAVALCSRHEGEAIEVASAVARDRAVAALGLGADVSSPQAMDTFARTVERRLGPVSAVIANAAVLGPVGPIHTLDMTAWAKAVAIDFVGVANTIASFAGGMVDRRTGSIVTVTGGGIGGPATLGQVSAYTSSKAAVVALAETVGAELAPFNIRVNAIAPGAVATRFMDPLVDAGVSVVGEQLFTEVQRQRREPIDFHRIDALIRYLVDPDSPFVTGRMLSARWDSPELLRAEPPPPASARFRLRRIDEELYHEGLTWEDR
jgi:3-oxoacyl-[acyl-carrier protein] reductase